MNIQIKRGMRALRSMSGSVTSSSLDRRAMARRPPAHDLQPQPRQHHAKRLRHGLLRLRLMKTTFLSKPGLVMFFIRRSGPDWLGRTHSFTELELRGAVDGCLSIQALLGDINHTF